MNVHDSFITKYTEADGETVFNLPYLLIKVSVGTDTGLGYQIKCSCKAIQTLQHQHSQLQNRGLDLLHGEDEISHLPLCIDLSHNSSS